MVRNKDAPRLNRIKIASNEPGDEECESEVHVSGAFGAAPTSAAAARETRLRTKIAAILLALLFTLPAFAQKARDMPVHEAPLSANCDGTTADTSVLTSADITASAAGQPLSVTSNCEIASTLTITSPVIFAGTGELTVETGATVTLNGSVTAPMDAAIFAGAGSVVLPNAKVVSVGWWGALTALDAVNAFTAAMGSNRKIVCPAGTYTFDHVRSNRPATTLNFTSVYLHKLSNFELDCEGANILPGANLEASARAANGGVGVAYGLFEFDQDTDFTVHGFRFGGDYHSTAVQNTAFALMSDQKFAFKNINFSGNWGGLGNPFVGDWNVDGTFSDLYMPKVGICFDTGFLLRVSFRRIRAVGSDGATGSGVKCFSSIYDVPNLTGGGSNHTGLIINDTYGVSYTDNDVSNFGQPVNIVTGHGYTFKGNHWRDNPGTNVLLAPQSSVIFIGYAAAGRYPSTGHPPGMITIDSDVFENNGSTISVIKVDSSQITNSDVIEGITIANSIFKNNGTGSDAVISCPSANHLRNVATSGNAFLGTNATHTVSCGGLSSIRSSDSVQ
jgi:hypothetical protein